MANASQMHTPEAKAKAKATREANKILSMNELDIKKDQVENVDKTKEKENTLLDYPLAAEGSKTSNQSNNLEEIQAKNLSQYISMSPLKIIRQKCLECCGWSAKYIKYCTSFSCPLWAWRFGMRPTRAALKHPGLMNPKKIPPEMSLDELE
jgi:hypothetical protein